MGKHIQTITPAQIKAAAFTQIRHWERQFVDGELKTIPSDQYSNRFIKPMEDPEKAVKRLMKAVKRRRTKDGRIYPSFCKGMTVQHYVKLFEQHNYLMLTDTSHLTMPASIPEGAECIYSEVDDSLAA